MSLRIAYFAIFAQYSRTFSGRRTRSSARTSVYTMPARRRFPGTAQGRRDAPAAVSRILCSPRTEAAIICLCDQNPGLIAPRATASSPIWSCCGRGLPCDAAFADAPGGLLPRLFTLASDASEAVSFLWHWPSRGIWSAVSFFSKGLPALCSPDFPQRPRSELPAAATARSRHIPIDLLI